MAVSRCIYWSFTYTDLEGPDSTKKLSGDFKILNHNIKDYFLIKIPIKAKGTKKLTKRFYLKHLS